MRTRTLIAGLAAGLVLLTAACGGGDGASAGSGGGTRLVEVAMVDIDFEPQSLDVAKGEEVRFEFTNDGELRHEAYFGTPDDQAAHEQEMARGGEDADGHDAHGGGDDDKITVEPGQSGDLTYRFDRTGAFEIGCHEPGHYAAGMAIRVNAT